MAAEPTTPLMRQYNSVKQQVPNALLMFRLGDFYELFYEDAVVAARELEITLTSRNKEKGAAIPMCGVPYHSAESYIARLIQKGHRVAICDQMEDARLAKKLVKREITRIVTPGTATDAHLLRSAREQLPGVGGAERGARRRGARGCFDRRVPRDGTGAVRSRDAPSSSWARAKCCSPAICRCSRRRTRAGACCEPNAKSWTFSYDYADRTLRDHFKLLSLDGCGLAGRHAAICAAGRHSALLAGDATRGARPSGPAHPITTAPRAWCWMR